MVTILPKAEPCLLPFGNQTLGWRKLAPPWSYSSWQNARRCDLIDKEVEGTITPDEVKELYSLQQAMLRYRRRVAPLPLEDARRLHQELLQKAQRQTDARCGTVSFLTVPQRLTAGLQ